MSMMLQMFVYQALWEELHHINTIYIGRDAWGEIERCIMMTSQIAATLSSVSLKQSIPI